MKYHPNQITLSQAIQGYMLAAQARHLSEHTLFDYTNTFRKFAVYLADDPPLVDITTGQVEGFLAGQVVSKKTILNYHTGLSALWTWAVKEELVGDHILHQVRPPDPERRAIEPLSEDDIHRLLNAITHSQSYTRPHKGETRHALPNAERNRAIILTLLDTGLRANELCSIPLRFLDLRNRTLKVFGKGSKERILPFCARTGQALWKYCSQYRDGATQDKPVFVTIGGNPLDRNQLLKMLVHLGKRAGVNDVHPHRFRHTFAINYLRNGGDPWSLQMMLGHSSMEMVRKYLAIAQADLSSNHRRASPVDNWHL